MKQLSNIAGALLGLAFIAFSVMFLANIGPEQPAPEEGSAAAMFMGAMHSTGYLKFVKVLELLGGILVAIPRTRNFGLLVLVPIVVNILAYHAFIMDGEGLMNPIILVICALSLFLLLSARKAIAGLVT